MKLRPAPRPRARVGTPISRYLHRPPRADASALDKLRHRVARFVKGDVVETVIRALLLANFIVLGFEVCPRARRAWGTRGGGVLWGCERRRRRDTRGSHVRRSSFDRLAPRPPPLPLARAPVARQADRLDQPQENADQDDPQKAAQSSKRTLFAFWLVPSRVDRHDNLSGGMTPSPVSRA